ncbi:hypothetical protein [Mesorhizobium sp.]|uniref:hypothetical protein n=1 Tax=Mesorhizobium sp. TaxID=1871066 RepID=UPI0025ECB6BD|nr:hypothetical protein [Mesorhizobium sp.]
MLGGIEVHADCGGKFIDVEMRPVESVDAVRYLEAVMLGMGKLAGCENTKRRRLHRRRRNCLCRPDICLDDVINDVVKRIQRRVDNRAIGGAANIAIGVQEGSVVVDDAGACLGRHEKGCGAD